MGDIDYYYHHPDLPIQGRRRLRKPRWVLPSRFLEWWRRQQLVFE
jgi:hypothetical protein